jgi:hypothetical protein
MSSSRAIYWAVGGVLAVLLVVMLFTWNYNKATPEAVAKADQLISKYESTGQRAGMSAEQVARVLGTDGGEVCAAARSDYLLGYAKTRLGVGGEFYFRPVIVDRHAVEGAVLIVRTYCPEAAPRLDQFIDGLKTAPLAGS